MKPMTKKNHAAIVILTYGTIVKINEYSLFAGDLLEFPKGSLKTTELDYV